MMKKLMVAWCLAVSMAAAARTDVYPQNFDAGGWSLDCQFMDVMGSPYLLAHGIGRPVVDARATIALPASGTYRVWVRSRNWAEGAPGRFTVLVNGKPLDKTFGASQTEWAWEDGGTVVIGKRDVEVRLHDLTGFDGRCAGVVFAKSDEPAPVGALQLDAANVVETISADFVVVGGGLPGCCAAVAAARSGVKTVLVQDRPVLGGNASSEIRVWSAGEGFTQPIIAELRGRFHNMEANSAIFDKVRRRIVEDEPNIDLRLCCRAFGVTKNADGSIRSVKALDWRRNRVIEIAAPLFLDATGDGWVGFWAGADYRMGREAASEFGEAYAPEKADGDTLGASLMWTSALANSDVPFSAPWAEASAQGHSAVNGEWNWEYGIHRDMIAEGEFIRDRLLKAIYGAFSLAKRDPAHSRRILDFVPFVLGKRESRRLIGDWVFNFNDITNHVEHADAIAKCSWSVDLHYDDVERMGTDYLTYCRQPHYGRTYVPFRSIYSRNIANLMMAGRCFSTTHVGLGSPRVMNTLAQMGVAAGYAAAICTREDLRPRQVFAQGFVREIQRRMGGDWPGNPDPAHATWRIVDDESDGVVFGKGWRECWNCNGEQEGHRSHCCGKPAMADEAVYPLPVAASGRYRIYAKTPFAPWPREKMYGKAAYRVETAEGDQTVLVDHYLHQGQWQAIGEFALKPGAKLVIVPRASTVAGTLFADGIAIEPVRMPLEWHPTYDTSVPYEVEISPAKLQNLAGADPAAGFAVTAQTAAGAKQLDLVTLPGRAKGTVRLRFTVPEKTTSLSCAVEGAKAPLANTAALDNLFAGALAPDALPKWNAHKSVKASALPNGGIALRGSEYGSFDVSYVVPVPEGLAGKPVAFELDVTSRTKMTWGGQIKLVQFDAAGQALPEYVVDPRWTGHMRPCDKFIPYREPGRFHPEARKVAIVFEMRGAQKDIDQHGLPLTDKDALMPKLDVTHLALRPAADLPFPKYDDSFFAQGVTGQPEDKAFNFAGGHAVWYQTRSWASWAQATQLRKEEQLFFPSAAGTVEAWFKAESLPKDATLTLFQASHHQAYVARGSVYKESRGNVCAVLWNAAQKAISFTLKDSDDKVFEKSAPVELPVGRWFHVAASWTPGGEAALFLDGRRVLAFSVADYKPYDLVNTKCPNDYHCTEFYFGCNRHSTRSAASPRADLPHFPGVGDLLRVSTGARYATDFTPAKSFALDAATRALFSFDRSFDGVSGGGIGWIPGTVLSKAARVDRRLDVGGRTVQYYPAEILPENDPDKVLNRLNYPVMPTPAEFRAARRSRTASATLAPGGELKVNVGAKAVYTDFIAYANVSDEPLMHPLLINQGEIDPRSFGDISDSLGVAGFTDRDRANAVFNFVLGASDYFMSHQSICDAWSDVPRSVEYEALIMLNSYCGFECGPLNNLAANMFACSGQCPASQTGGYGHSFEEVFYDGKNHIYDLSAQKFFPAMDNETAAYLAEDDNEPGIHTRLGGTSLSFIRNGNRGHRVQTPAFQPKVAMSLNPGERFKVWFANDGTANDIQRNSCYCGNRRVAFHIAKRVERGLQPYKEFQYECSEVTGLKPGKNCDVHVIDIFFPHYGNGFLTFDGVPAAANPAFVDVKADSFCYLVKSCYPVVAGEYSAVAKDGRPVVLEISTNRKTFDPVGVGKAVVDYRIRSRNIFLVRVKAPIGDIASFKASTEVIVNPRILPGKLKPGANALAFKATQGKHAQVTVGWREPAKEIVVAGGFHSGTIPGRERQTVLLDPAQPLVLDVTGASAAAVVKTYEGLEASLAGGKLTIRAGQAADPSLAALEIVDGEAVKPLTVLVASNARLLAPGAAKLSGTGVRRQAADGDSPQDRLVFAKADKSTAHFEFAPLPDGDYVLLSAVRFASHPPALHVSPLYAKFKGLPAIGCAQPANDATCFYKAHYGKKGERANWHWEFPNEPLSEYPYHLMRFLPFKGVSHVDFGLLNTDSGAVEVAGAIIMPAPRRAFKRQLMKVLCGLNCDPWLVRGAMPAPEKFTLERN